MFIHHFQGQFCGVEQAGSNNIYVVKLLTIRAFPGETIRVKITRSGQVTIPPAMRRKHGLLARAEVELVDQPDGVLVVKATTTSRGKRVLATLLRGGKIKSRTKDWLRLTRG
jgi:bifunctional DNA-binding transcriptional regulator/antitoxin component of YhaV-PrlF toxin-antitoxin module